MYVNYLTRKKSKRGFKHSQTDYNHGSGGIVAWWLVTRLWDWQSPISVSFSPHPFWIHPWVSSYTWETAPPTTRMGCHGNASIWVPNPREWTWLRIVTFRVNSLQLPNLQRILCLKHSGYTNIVYGHETYGVLWTYRYGHETAVQEKRNGFWFLDLLRSIKANGILRERGIVYRWSVIC